MVGGRYGRNRARISWSLDKQHCTNLEFFGIELAVLALQPAEID
jgi:hypothetical protein